jgi:hypothetical protein
MTIIMLPPALLVKSESPDSETPIVSIDISQAGSE